MVTFLRAAYDIIFPRDGPEKIGHKIDACEDALIQSEEVQSLLPLEAATLGSSATPSTSLNPTSQ